MFNTFGNRLPSMLRLAVLFVALMGFIVQAEAVELKIMPLGDSITCGCGAPGGYRLPLYNLLTTAGYDFQFVGSDASNPASGLPANQVNHEGHIAYTIQDCTTVADNQVRTGILENVEGWLNSANPTSFY